MGRRKVSSTKGGFGKGGKAGKKCKFSHHKKQWKAVSKYSKDGEFICTYPSMTIAAAETGNKVQNISNACIKGCKCGGFYWTRE